MREEEKKEERADRGPRGPGKHMRIKRMVFKMAQLHRIRGWRLGSGAQTMGWRGLGKREGWEVLGGATETETCTGSLWDLTSHIMSRWTGPLSWALQFFLYFTPEWTFVTEALRLRGQWFSLGSIKCSWTWVPLSYLPATGLDQSTANGSSACLTLGAF